MERIFGVVAVQNHGTSGSTLMQSLLDSHPRILSLPCLHGHSLYLFWETHHSLAAKELLVEFLKQHAYWGDPSLVPDTLGLQEMGENRDQPTKIDLDAFAAALKELGWDSSAPLTRTHYIKSIYMAYAKALGRSLNETSYWVVFPIHGHSAERAKYLAEDFEKTYFLHTTREPVQNMGSGAKHILKEPFFGDIYLLEANTRQIFLEHAVHIQCKDVRGVHYYMNDNAKVQSKTVRLEDMHKDSENTMRKIAQWLDIDWDPVLLKSTYDGKLWNNRPTSVRQTGLGTATLQQKHSEIFNAFDRWRIFQAGRHLFLFYNYASKEDFAPEWVRRYILPVLFLLPFKVEWSCNYTRLAYRALHSRYFPAQQPAPVTLKGKVRRLIRQIRLLVKTGSKIVGGPLRARLSLLEVWQQSFKPIESNQFVPLLHYKQS